MARNQHAVIWTRLSGTAEKMGDLVLAGEQASFTYTREYLASGRPGFCLLGDGAIWGADSVTYPVSERIPVFPRLLSLVPGNNPRNLQRRHYLDLLRKQLGREPPPGVETSTTSFLRLPSRARAIGEVMEILPCFTSASSSPTMRYLTFSSVSSSTRVTVAPNMT